MSCPYRFIVLDGVEGAGKSTQIERLAEALRAGGEDVLVTIEPGGSPIGEAVRDLLLSPDYPEMTPLTELFLFCASRAQHCDEVVRPALEAGKVVVCDRFTAATFAYQGYAGEAGEELVVRLDAEATRGLVPDMTIILDLPPEEGLARKFGAEAVSTANADRIERNELRFHLRVRQGFQEYARRYPDRTAIVDASQTEDEVFAEVCRALAIETA
ncbi:MAG: dTMP kinase [Armatimonadota bacterium]|nr:dTMP kinase [Armatimonadota bacterium]